MCQTRNNTSEPATSSQCSGCQRKGLGQCPAARLQGAQQLPVLNSVETSPSTSTAPVTFGSSSPEPAHSN